MPTFARDDNHEETTDLDLLVAPDHPELVQLEVARSRAWAATLLTPGETELLFPHRATPRVG